MRITKTCQKSCWNSHNQRMHACILSIHNNFQYLYMCSYVTDGKDSILIGTKDFKILRWLVCVSFELIFSPKITYWSNYAKSRSCSSGLIRHMYILCIWQRTPGDAAVASATKRRFGSGHFRSSYWGGFKKSIRLETRRHLRLCSENVASGVLPDVLRHICTMYIECIHISWIGCFFFFHITSSLVYPATKYTKVEYNTSQ